MQSDTIDLIEPTPEPQEPRCKALVCLLRAALSFTSYLAALLTWYRYDLFFAAAAFLIAYVVMGIVRSKLRNEAVPLSQREYNYTDKAIAQWYVSRVLLCA